MRTAVVGHVEWVQFVRVDRVPATGEIVRGHESWEEPAGGGAVAAVQLAKLADETILFTALGGDEFGHRAHRDLGMLGPHVEAMFRSVHQRRAITYIDAAAERTITVLGERLAPSAADPLPWDELQATDAVYFTAGDAGALRCARRARVLVATSRILPLLTEARVHLDAIVGSELDAGERYRHGDLEPPQLVVRTAGGEGGRFEIAGEPSRAYSPAPLPGPIADSYGCGDSFAAGLTYALGAGYSPEDAVGFAAACGAAVLTGRGPYQGQLSRSGRRGRGEFS